MAVMEAILDFQLARFELFFMYKSSRCFLASLESIGLSVQEKKLLKMAAMVAILDF